MAKPQVSYRSDPVRDGAHLFPGLNVFDVQRHSWFNVDLETDRGRYWTATDDNGITWLSDGRERIAAFPSRMFRFYLRGIAARRHHLVNRYLKRLVPKPDGGGVVINFGANVGEAAITFAEQGASVLAVEPDPNVIPLLRANAAGRSIEVAPVAAWNTDGLLKLYLKSETADSSSFNVTDQSTMAVSRRIDTLVRERGIVPEARLRHDVPEARLRHDRVHLIIGDAEGAEPEVLDGARETLKVTEYVSVCASAERCGERTLWSCEAILKAAGFHILHREDTGFGMLIGRNPAFMEKAA